MDLKEFNERAIACHKEFIALREEFTAYANEHTTDVSNVDKTVVRKLNRFPGDITTARLATVSTKLLKK